MSCPPATSRTFLCNSCLKSKIIVRVVLWWSLPESLLVIIEAFQGIERINVIGKILWHFNSIFQYFLRLPFPFLAFNIYYLDVFITIKVKVIQIGNPPQRSFDVLYSLLCPLRGATTPFTNRAWDGVLNNEVGSHSWVIHLQKLEVFPTAFTRVPLDP